jgi:hypothetical protein
MLRNPDCWDSTALLLGKPLGYVETQNCVLKLIITKMKSWIERESHTGREGERDRLRDSRMTEGSGMMLFVQEELEAHDGVSKGKYTIGLGQDRLVYCTDLEDVISMRCPSPCFYLPIIFLLNC